MTKKHGGLPFSLMTHFSFLLVIDGKRSGEITYTANKV